MICSGLFYAQLKNTKGRTPVVLIPDYVRTVLDRLESGGHNTYLVGGCLRDMLLGRPIHDWDVATTASGAAIAALFPRTAETGLRFGTITVITGEGTVEVTTLRSDGAYHDRRRPDSVLFVNDLNEDLKRRDFTMNAMAMTRSGEIKDPFGGQEDIKRRLIRCVGEAEARLNEDALRTYRALRFSAQLSFDIEEHTMAAVKKCAPLCAGLSAERVRDETEKILMSDMPEIIGSAVECGLYAGRLKAIKTKPEKLGNIAKLPKNSMMRWSAFCALLLNGGLIDSAADFLCQMRLDAQTVKNGGAGAAAALRRELTDRLSIKKKLSQSGVEMTLCEAAADEALCGGDAVSRVEEVLKSGECFSYKDLAVSGNDLLERGFKQGTVLGQALKKLLEHVIENPENNNRETLLLLAEKAQSQGEISR